MSDVTVTGDALFENVECTNIFMQTEATATGPALRVDEEGRAVVKLETGGHVFYVIGQPKV